MLNKISKTFSGSISQIKLAVSLFSIQNIFQTKPAQPFLYYLQFREEACYTHLILPNNFQNFICYIFLLNYFDVS